MLSRRRCGCTALSIKFHSCLAHYIVFKSGFPCPAPVFAFAGPNSCPLIAFGKQRRTTFRPAQIPFWKQLRTSFRPARGLRQVLPSILKKKVPTAGFEPLTSWLLVRRSTNWAILGWLRILLFSGIMSNCWPLGTKEFLWLGLYSLYNGLKGCKTSIKQC